MSTHTTMTIDHFNALAQLLRLRPGPAREAARLVLVDGMTQADAARKLDVSPNTVTNAVARARAGLVLVRKVIL